MSFQAKNCHKNSSKYVKCKSKEQLIRILNKLVRLSVPLFKRYDYIKYYEVWPDLLIGDGFISPYRSFAGDLDLNREELSEVDFIKLFSRNLFNIYGERKINIMVDDNDL